MDAKTPNADAIRELRIARGMTQEKLARLSGVDVKTLYRAERGDMHMRLETLLDLAAALDVPVARIVAEARGDEGSSATAPESYLSMVLRRVERASEYADLAAECEHYAFRVKLDPDEPTAERMRELLELTRRMVLGAEAARDRFDADGELSEPARLARLKALLLELREAGVSVLANRFVETAPDAEAPRVVLHVVFAEGDVRRAAMDPRRASELERQDGKVIGGVRALDFRVHASSVMGVLKLALETLGDDVSYAFLMGASGAAFRLQIAHPTWCPSAPYAGVGSDCIPHAAAALGRALEWIGPQDERRIPAIVGSIDRGVPALHAAEECGLIVGYHEGGRRLSLRTYFDTSAAYALLDRPGWASTGILGERTRVPQRVEILRASLARALELAETSETFPTHRGDVYLCGFAAWREWSAGLRDSARHAARAGSESAVALRANGWIYRSLIDARSAASVYLSDFARASEPDIAAPLERAASGYQTLVQRLQAGLAHVPWFGNDATTAWTDEGRRAQADALDACAELERGALDALRAALSLLAPA